MLHQPRVFGTGFLLGGRSTLINALRTDVGAKKTCNDISDIDAEEYFEPANHRPKILAP